MQALDWYVTLALWKAVVFMEGNYKRAISGSDRRPLPQEPSVRASSSSPTVRSM